MADHALAPMPPESRQARMLGVHTATMCGPNNTWNSDAGYLLFDRYARNLPGVEDADHLRVVPDASRPTSATSASRRALKRTDAAFWRVFDFTFIEGDAYSRGRRRRGALRRGHHPGQPRQRLFGGRPALGKSFEADGQTFRVVGVVENVPDIRMTPFGDLFAPLTTAKTDAYKREVMGGFHAVVLARSTDDLPIIREEFNARLAKVELPEKGFTALVAPFETPYDSLARESPFGDRKEPRPPGLEADGVPRHRGLALRHPADGEPGQRQHQPHPRARLGDRRAQGLRRADATLVAQFVVENVILTLAGGAIGLVLSALVLRAINQSGIVRPRPRSR